MSFFLQHKNLRSTAATPQRTTSVVRSPKIKRLFANRLRFKFAEADAKQGAGCAQPRSVHEVLDEASTAATPRCASSKAEAQTKPRSTKRLRFKFAEGSAGPGARSAEAERIEIREAPSTAATPRCASSVEFKTKSRGFTLLEVILAMAIMVLLAGAIYAISTAAIESTKAAIVEQFTMRRLAGFLQITRNAFLNLPAQGAVFLSNDSNNSISDLSFENATGLFGVASLGGGTLILSAQPSSDGTRTFSIVRVPKNLQGTELTHYFQSASWIKLLPKVNKPHWSFFSKGEWLDDWPRGAGRPQLVRLQMEVAGVPDPIETIFYVPAVNKVSFGAPNVPVMPPNSNAPNTPNQGMPPGPSQNPALGAPIGK